MAACALVAGRSVIVADATASTAEHAPSSLRGSVLATGEPATLRPTNRWSSARTDDGSYLVVVRGGGEVSVTSWEGIATVDVTPVGDGAAVVTFTGPDGVPVDAGFTFLAR